MNMSKAILTLTFLVISNTFMTLAWYGNLKLQEMKIISLKVAGCKMHEIAKREHLTFQEINELLANCKDDIIHILWGEERRAAA